MGGLSIFRGAFGAIIAATTITPAFAAPPADSVSAKPSQYQQLLDCRSQSDPQQRLACYDRQVAALDAAIQSREVAITDRERIREARRGLFGFTASIGRLFGGGGNDTADEAEEVKRIETTVASVRHTADGGWKLGFADGGVWEQTDTRDWPLSPKVGNAVVVTRGALGSYFVSVDGQQPIKMRRVQ